MTSRSDWLEWRKKGIGSSDSPVIMGVSPWKTPLELWKEKTGRVPLETETSFIQQKGIDLEPKARASYELLRDVDMPAACLTHPVHSFLLASLDGYNSGLRRFLEIKFVGAPDAALALRADLPPWERVPEKYRWQIHHQFMVSGALGADYYAFTGETGTLVELERNLSAEAKLFQAEEAFWRLVQTDTPPALTARDYLEVSDPECVRLCEDWKVLKVAGKSRALDQVREELKRYLVHPRVECAGVRLLEVNRSSGKTFEVRLKENL